jgi:AcrR family transcriptional regulator
MRKYGGATADERQAERRTQLLDAGLELMASDGAPQNFTVRGVCREAGLASRYFYENFEDLEDLAVTVYDDEVLALTIVSLTALDDIDQDDDEARVLTGLGALIGQIAEDPRRGRLFYSPALSSFPAIAARRRESTRLFVGLLVDQANPDAPPGGPSDVVSEILVGGLAQAISAWLDGDLTLPQEEFVDGCSRVFLDTLART